MSRRHEHVPTWVGPVAVSACPDCGEVTWLSERGTADPAEGLAHLFGSYDLVDHLDLLGGPAPTALAYAPPSSRKRCNLDLFPKHRWMKVAPRLWLSHDGQVLLLATTQRLLIDNLTRGA